MLDQAESQVSVSTFVRECEKFVYLYVLFNQYADFDRVLFGQLENGGSWKNPDAPVDYGTEKDRANCPFFLKTGACRFGDR